jgi:hypothetical protein
VDPDAPNVLQAMMQLQQAKSRAEAANKLALEAVGANKKLQV